METLSNTLRKLSNCVHACHDVVQLVSTTVYHVVKFIMSTDVCTSPAHANFASLCFFYIGLVAACGGSCLTGCRPVDTWLRGCSPDYSMYRFSHIH